MMFKEIMISPFFTRIKQLLLSKSNNFCQALEYEKRNGGEVLDIDDDEQWFVILSCQNIKELQQGGPAMLVLFHRKSSSIIAKMSIVNDTDKNELFIGDFSSNIENKGYGSILLQNVIKLAKQLGCKTIGGNLSSVDSDHFDKLRHLYEKYGFEVKINGDSGAILYKV